MRFTGRIDRDVIHIGIPKCLLAQRMRNHLPIIIKKDKTKQ